MNEEEKVICIIPARSGSKRIPRKNLLQLDGVHCLAITISRLLESGAMDRVIVSTDSLEIAGVAERAGAEIPKLRSSHLASDYATTISVVKSVIEDLELKSNAPVLCAYPLSMLSSERISEFVKSYEPGRFLVTVGELRVPPRRLLYEVGSGLLMMGDPTALDIRTQDLEKAYFDAGKLYLAPADLWLSSQNMLSDTFHRFTLGPRESLDVDTPEDWAFLQTIWKIAH